MRPGVLAVFTHRNMPRMNPTPKPWSHLHPHGQSYLPLQDDKIHYAGQPIALVVAATLDQASHAGTLISVEYEAQRPLVFGPHMAMEAVDPPQFLWPVGSSVGDADEGIAAGAVRIEQTYTTSDRHHNQMEPHATAAVWESDGTLTLYETTQHIFGTKELVSIVLGVPPAKINVVSHFLGGGFGGKGYVWPHTLLAALAAKVLNRPVRLQLTRAQMYSMAGHQAATIQTIALGAGKDGKLTGIRHDSTSPTPVFDNYIEYAALCLALAMGCQRRHFDKPQGRPREPQHADRDALSARGARAFRARERDGRACLCDRRRSGRIALAQRHGDRPAERPPLLDARRAQVPDGRSCALRLGQADARAAVDARRPLPDRPGDGGCDLYALALAGEGAGHR